MLEADIAMHDLGSQGVSPYSAVSSVHDNIDADSVQYFSPKQPFLISRVPVGRSGDRHDNSQNRTPFVPGDTRNPPGSDYITPTTLLSTLAWWLPELFASALSVISLCSIVGILYMFDGRAAADVHLPRYLTLNGLIAAIATINRACLSTPVCSAMMQEMWLYFARESKRPTSKSRLQDLDIFAEASNSVTGSIKFLAHARGRRLIACMGCLITILSLAYSTFIQQLVGLAVLPVSGNASIGNLPWTQSLTSGGGIEPLPLTMKAAVYNGIMGGPIEPMQAACPTGNCTWPLTWSLAVCGACSNTAFVVEDCTMDHYCNYTLPGDSSALLYDFEHYTTDADYWDARGINDPEAIADLSGPPGFIVLPSNDNFVFNVGGDDKRVYIAQMNLFGAPYNSKSQSTLKYTNTECQLWWCAQQYETIVDSSAQYQAITEQVDEQTLNLDDSDYLEYTAVSASQDISNFTVSGNMSFALNFYFTKLLNDSGANSISLTRDLPIFIANNDLILGMWNGTRDPDTWISNLATSMTNAVRSLNATSTPNANGTSYELAITVRWLWLVVPIALVFLSILFLFAVIIRTALAPVRSWKGSPMTLLLFDLDTHIKDAGRSQMDRKDGVKKAIGKTKVKYVAKRNGDRSFMAC